MILQPGADITLYCGTGSKGCGISPCPPALAGQVKSGIPYQAETLQGLSCPSTKIMCPKDAILQLAQLEPCHCPS